MRVATRVLVSGEDVTWIVQPAPGKRPEPEFDFRLKSLGFVPRNIISLVVKAVYIGQSGDSRSEAQTA